MKQMKILGVLGIALTLGLTACTKSGGDSGKSEPAPSSEKHTHTAAEGAQWQMNDTQHWKDCKDNDGGKVDAGSHKWEKDTSKTDVAATCQAEGKAYEKCSVCGKTRERTLSKAAHTYEQVDGADKVTWTKEATCEEGGVGTKECTVCHEKADVTADPLGHTYAQDESGVDKVDWIREATCELAGLGTKTCTRCGEKVDVDVKALGHNPQLVGEQAEPAPGKALVRQYACANEGCDQSYLGFKANEVSEESKSHLVIGEDGGARFWGRPIGNDVVLNEQGDPDESSHEAVFNDQQPGDFFEYVFDLTKEQADKLDNCLLYCEATPAQWMRNNGMDFWACKPGDTDWTRGMYIDDIAETEENEKGTDIDDYRYILYVDDQPKAFDDSIKNPVTSDAKGTYILPYVFKLHEGENKISLRMAGGYRSTFYNFTFRQIEEKSEGEEGDHVHIWASQGTKVAADAEKGTVAYTKYACRLDGCTSVKIEVKLDDSMLAAGSANKNDPAGYLKLAKNDQSFSFKFEYDSLDDATLFQGGVMDNWDSNKSKKVFSGKSGGADDFELTVNGSKVDVSAYKSKTWAEIMTGEPQSGGLSALTDVESGKVVLQKGVNEVVYKRVASYNLALKTISFVIDAPHAHDFKENGAAVKNAAGQDVQPLKCACGSEGLQMALADADGASNIDSGNKVKNGSTLKWKFKGAKAGKVSFQMYAKLGSGDNPFANGGNKGNYTLKAGASEGTITCAGKKLSEYGATNAISVFFEMGQVTIAATDIDENGEVEIAITFPTTQDYRHVYTGNVRIVYVD